MPILYRFFAWVEVMIRRSIKSFTKVPDFNELPLKLKTTILQVEVLVFSLLLKDGCLPIHTGTYGM